MRVVQIHNIIEHNHCIFFFQGRKFVLFLCEEKKYLPVLFSPYTIQQKLVLGIMNAFVDNTFIVVMNKC